MIEYNREILSLYVKPENGSLRNIVKRVTWRYRARDEAFFADIYRDTYFADVDPKNFLNYQELTDEVVFGWIDSAENMDAITDELNCKLESSKNPSMVEKKIPWNLQSKYTDDEEYLIVFDGQPNNTSKIWGPMRWNSDRANNGLRTRGIHDYEFPTDVVMYQRELLPTDQPLIPTDRVKVYRVVYTEQPVLDERFQYHEGLTWVVNSGQAVGTYFVIDRDLNESKRMMQDQLSLVSFQKQNAGTEIALDNLDLKINTDLPARLTLMQRWLLMGDQDTINHKINESAWLNLTRTECKQILDAIDRHVSTVLDWERTLFDKIESAVTANDLKKIEI